MADNDIKDNPIWLHHQKNVDEGTYVKNDDGSISTVYTTIMGDGEYEYLIPQVWDGEILEPEQAWDRAMASGIDWPREPSGEEGVRRLEELDRVIHEGMSGYAEGGEVMSLERQMSLFEEGGIADDGMDMDPVSGNEVPPGSMAVEVRDDIPAQLSEGEYVVPADVVRYYGVRFFEQLRSEAKEGLGEMEANGRIGGEPVPAGGPRMEEEGALTQEELAALAEMGLAVGGLIPQPMAQTPDPYAQQKMMYDTPVAVGNTGFAKGYVDGGLEDGNMRMDRADIIKPSFTSGELTSAFPLGFSFTDKAEGTAAETTVDEATEGEFITLYGPNGEVQVVSLPSQQALYDQLISQGYSTDPTTFQKKVQEEREGRDGDLAQDTGPAIADMTGGQLQEAQKSLDKFANVAKNLPGVIGLVAGLVAKSQQNQIDSRAKELGLTPQKDITVTNKQTGKSRSVKAGPSYATQDLAGIRTAKAMTPEEVQAGIKYAAEGDARATSWGGGFEKGGGEVAENQNAPSHGTAAEAQAAAEAAAKDLGVGMATSGRATGGLVSRRSKKKK